MNFNDRTEAHRFLKEQLAGRTPEEAVEFLDRVKAEVARGFLHRARAKVTNRTQMRAEGLQRVPTVAEATVRGGGIFIAKGIRSIPILDLDAVQRFFRTTLGERNPILQHPTFARIVRGAFSRGVAPGIPIHLARLFREELGAFLAPIGRQIAWSIAGHNLVVSSGLEHLINGSIAGATQITQWYVIPTDGTPTIVAGDTYASHTGWSEVTSYDEANRQTYDEADNGVGALSNTASPATLTISATVTIGGAALVGGGSAPSTKNNTAGGGTLLCAVAFTGGDRNLVDNDVLEITYNTSVADDGA